MSKSKFKIGDHLVNLQTGVKVSGIVVGLTTGDFYLLRKNEKDVPYWTQFYGDWKQKCVYFLKLDKPAPHCTITDFIKYKPADVSEMEAVVQFNKVPKLDHMAYPEDDLKKG